MAHLSTKIKEYAKANGVADVNFQKIYCYKMMVLVFISKNGT